MIPKIDVRNPSVCRSGRWKRRRSVNAVSMARWEYFGCPPRVPLRAGSQVVMAPGTPGHVASADQSSIIRGPVGDAVFRFVRGMDS